MTTRTDQLVKRRQSVPLTERDEHDLAMLRTSPEQLQALARLVGAPVDRSDVSEAALLHALLAAGLASVRSELEAAGYAAIAAERERSARERRATARRRRPSWADEA